MAHSDYKVLGKGRLNDPIIGHPAMKGRRWMIDYGYDSGKTFKKLKDESMEYKDYFSEFETDDTSSNKLQGGVGDATGPSDVNPAELALGVQVEMEHTNDINIATELALDHLTNEPKYYSKLVKAGLTTEFVPAPNSGFGDPDHPINDRARLGSVVTPTAGNNVVGTIGNTSDGKIEGRRSEPILQKENKSTTKYEEYKNIAEKTIERLMGMARKKKSKYSDEEKMITSSYIKSVLIGLGNSDEKLSEKLKALAPLAYNPKKISKTDLNEKKSKKPKPTKPDLWSRAKSLAKNKFDVYPSIYANAWAAKWYKSKGGGWRM